MILHIAAECYPAAKAGGLGDVVGALPKYLNAAGVQAAVVIPKYGTKWLRARRYQDIYRGWVRLNNAMVYFAIEKVMDVNLGYELFVVNIPGKFDRNGIYADEGGYGYGDDVERYLCFQQAVLKWVQWWETKPRVLHCHDHHTALIPFMITHSPEYSDLRSIPTVFTIHNGMYQGMFGWDKQALLPWYDGNAHYLLDWNGVINPFACAIRCAWRFTTVSPGYMNELMDSALGVETLIRNEWRKAAGIINGIDADIWNPSTDSFIAHRYNGNIAAFKAENKKVLCQRFRVRPDLPLIVFIGRLVGEKGADLLPEAIKNFLQSGRKASFVVLGSGDHHLGELFKHLTTFFPGYFDCSIEYNEALSHQLYAGADFLVMPSRVEPCGLNQLYSMRYGTVPIVRSVGGLKDTVSDIGEPLGRGIRFNRFDAEDIYLAFYRATQLYENQSSMQLLRERIMALDFSWEASVEKYVTIYNEITT